MNDADVYSVFENSLHLHRDRVAVCHGDALHSYGELGRAIDTIAGRLRALGCRPQSRICLAVRHGVDLVASALAVLKIGATYVPIDRRNPIDRIKFILSDSEATFIIYSPENAELFSELKLPGLCTAHVEATGERVTREPIDPSNLAYILYTSGSTANPKGVGISHENLLSYVLWARDRYIRSVDDRIALYTTLAFDFTVTCIFPPLIAGASIGIYDGIANPMVIQDILEDPKINVLKITPSYLYVLSQLLDGQTRLQRLIVGGEDLKVNLAAKVHGQLMGRVEIINEYGPTEATVGCIVHAFDPETDTGGSVAIGRPIPGMQAYVLDSTGSIIDDDREGELCVSGRGVARGYLNLEARSREVFVDDPFRPGTRMYRTGDIVKRQADGNLVFVGRRDEQVKIRGNRVELSEVTAAVLAHPGVESAYVTAVPEHGTNTLAAVVTGARALTEDGVMAELHKRLPSYMVPSVIKVVSELPLTPNQKVDRAQVLGILGKRRG